MRHLLPFLLLLLALPAQAANESYYAYTLHPTVFYKSILEGCQDIAHAYINDSWEIISYHSLKNGSQCQYTAKSKSSGTISAPVSGQTPVRVGTCTQGDEGSITWPIGPTDAANPSDIIGSANLPPNPACSNGCMVAVGDPTDCYTFEDGSSPFTFCDFDGQKTGAACSTTDEPTPPDTSSCPPGTVASGSACAPETPPDPCEADPNAAGCSGGGDTGGGDTGGGNDCEANPTAEGCTGGGDTGGGDTGGGDTGGGDTGGGDTGGGDTGGGDNGGGDSGGDTGTVSGMECNVGLACSGDAIQCATLRFQKDEYCANQKAMDYPSQEGDIKDFLNQPEYKAEPDEEVDLGSMFSECTRFLPSGCPSPESVALTTAGGRTFQFTYEPLCQLATDLSYLIVAAAGIFFAVYVGRAAGGA